MTPNVDKLRALINELESGPRQPHLGDRIAYALFDRNWAYAMLPHIYDALKFNNPSVDGAMTFTEALMPNGAAIKMGTVRYSVPPAWAKVTVDSGNESRHIVTADGATLAAALVLAALKAKLAEVEGQA